jgi:hypothetical protein
MRLITTILLFLYFQNTNVQILSECNCGALIDVEFKDRIVVYDKPNGLIIKKIQHNFDKEDFLILTIDKDTTDYFHVMISYSLTEKKGMEGWIKKGKSIGVFAKNYSNPQILNLYLKPSLKSKVKSIIPKWVNQFYVIEKCSGKWVYVKIQYKCQSKEGWLQPDKQCDNPYTTCN